MRVGATEFKAKCLEFMDDLARSRRMEIVVTKRGKPVAILVPFNEPHSFIGSGKGSITMMRGDLTAPLDVGWEALQE